MVNSNNYRALTEKVSNLITRYNELKEEYSSLEEKVSGYEKERVKTKTSVETIISRIEELECE